MTSTEMWDQAIADAREELAIAEQHVREALSRRNRLKYAVRVFTQNRDNHQPWPGLHEGRKTE